MDDHSQYTEQMSQAKHTKSLIIDRFTKYKGVKTD